MTRPLRAFLTSPGYEAILAAEIGGVKGPQWPGVVTHVDIQEEGLLHPRSAAGGGREGGVPPTEWPLDPVWARQQLPKAVHVKADSVGALADASYAVVQSAVDAAEQGFTVHAFVPDPEAYGSLAGRAKLVGEALLALLQERRRRAFRRHVPAAEARARWGELQVVQLALVGRGSLLVSVARPAALPRGGYDLAPWPAGIAPVDEDRAAPSRAYGKLEESFAWLGAAPSEGQTCVDLGGAPGGWAWKALQRGARVVAVDRAPLVPPAAGHPSLSMLQGNAFTYQPPAPVDWLLCDVICEPPRTVELVDRWLARGWCRAVVATIKFKGAASYGLLSSAAERLAAHDLRYLRFKHLFRHHNEVVILVLR